MLQLVPDPWCCRNQDKKVFSVLFSVLLKVRVALCRILKDTFVIQNL